MNDRKSKVSRMRVGGPCTKLQLPPATTWLARLPVFFRNSWLASAFLAGLASPPPETTCCLSPARIRITFLCNIVQVGVRGRCGCSAMIMIAPWCTWTWFLRLLLRTWILRRGCLISCPCTPGIVIWRMCRTPGAGKCTTFARLLGFFPGWLARRRSPFFAAVIVAPANVLIAMPAMDPF